MVIIYIFAAMSRYSGLTFSTVDHTTALKALPAAFGRGFEVRGYR